MKLETKKKCRYCGYKWYSEEFIIEDPILGIYVIELHNYCINCGLDFGEEIDE